MKIAILRLLPLTDSGATGAIESAEKALLAAELEGVHALLIPGQALAGYRPSAIETPSVRSWCNALSTRLNCLVLSELLEAAPDSAERFYSVVAGHVDDRIAFRSRTAEIKFRARDQAWTFAADRFAPSYHQHEDPVRRLCLASWAWPERNFETACHMTGIPCWPSFSSSCTSSSSSPSSSSSSSSSHLDNPVKLFVVPTRPQHGHRGPMETLAQWLVDLKPLLFVDREDEMVVTLVNDSIKSTTSVESPTICSTPVSAILGIGHQVVHIYAWSPGGNGVLLGDTDTEPRASIAFDAWNGTFGPVLIRGGRHNDEDEERINIHGKCERLWAVDEGFRQLDELIAKAERGELPLYVTLEADDQTPLPREGVVETLAVDCTPLEEDTALTPSPLASWCRDNGDDGCKRDDERAPEKCWVPLVLTTEVEA